MKLYWVSLLIQDTENSKPWVSAMSSGCANLYRTNKLSSFVVTVWDIDILKECVKLD